jgi:hypothetical protein
MPPRQPITTRRSFANTEWARALSPPCDDKSPTPTVSYTARAVSPPGTRRGAAPRDAVLDNLPPLSGSAPPGLARRESLPVIPLVDDKLMSVPDRGGDKQAATAFAPLPAPDVGDAAQPAIVPLAPASACGGV